MEYLGEDQQGNINEYIGRKIVALGFSSYFTPSNNIDAILDTSNYNIYIQEKQEFQVTRKDIITTDTLFYTNNPQKVTGAIHLAPIPNKAIIEPNTLISADGYSATYGMDKSYGGLYSIGLSSYTDYIDKEYVIGEDISVEQNENEIIINNIENYLNNNIQYTNNELYPNSSLYTTRSNYKYLIFKYKVYQEILKGTYEEPIKEFVDTGTYYYQAIPLNNKNGDLNLKIKYERG